MRKLLTKYIGLIVFAFVFVLAPFKGADAVTISPPFNETSLNPGDTEFGAIKLYNEDENNPITLYPLVRNFTHKDDDESGTPEFYATGERESRGTEMDKWIVVDPSPIVLAPRSYGSVQYAINVPKDQVQPGGHYGSILFSTEPPEVRGGSVGVGQQIAALLLVRVSGDVKEIGSIAEFGFKEKKLWYNYLPIDFFLRFENSGNMHLRPTGNVFIKNWYGRQVASIKVNEGFSGVLPLSIRRYEFGWHKGGMNEGDSEMMKEWKNFGFGKYKAQLVVSYGSQNKVVVEEREFTVWPWRLLIAFGVFLLIALIVLVVGVKMHNKNVIRRYEQSKK